MCSKTTLKHVVLQNVNLSIRFAGVLVFSLFLSWSFAEVCQQQAAQSSGSFRPCKTMSLGPGGNSNWSCNQTEKHWLSLKAVETFLGESMLYVSRVLAPAVCSRVLTPAVDGLLHVWSSFSINASLLRSGIG